MVWRLVGWIGTNFGVICCSQLQEPGREEIRVVRLSGQRVPGNSKLSKLSFTGGKVGLGARVGRVCGL